MSGMKEVSTLALSHILDSDKVTFIHTQPKFTPIHIHPKYLAY